MAELKKDVFDITGMSCSACAAHVQNAVEKVAGTSDVSVNLLENRMQLRYDPSTTDPQAIIAAVQATGYGASLHQQAESGHEQVVDQAAEQTRQGLRRLIWSFAFLLPLMYVGMGSMLGLPLPSFMDGTAGMMTKALTELLLTIPIMFINGHYFADGYRMLLKGLPNMDTLIAVGSSASFAYSLAMVYLMSYHLGLGNAEMASMYGMELYFESAGTILTLISLGKYFEARSKRQTSKAITELVDLLPKTASVERDGRLIEIPIDQLAVGDIAVVKAGQSVPADGVIISGSGTIDESALTGESVPVDRTVGDSVTGATINTSGYFRLRVSRIGADSALSQIVQLVEEASASKAPISRLADRIAGIFVPVVMAIAALTLAIWLILGRGFSFALTQAVAVLVISCPCALGLATPTAIMVGTGQGARHGILFRSAAALETLSSIDTVVLDKTGTVTQGRPQVVGVVPSAPVSRTQLLRWAASIEAASDHPLAKAISRYTADQGITAEAIDGVESHSGMGLTGISGGHRLAAGSQRLMDELAIPVQMSVADVQAMQNEGQTVMYFAADNHLAGLIAVADVIKPTSPHAIAALKAAGIETVMLTGDNQATAAAIQRQAGIGQAIAQVMPADKEAAVRRLQNQGHKVAMVGDGINDAPALARADVGMAIGSGTDVAIEAADVVLMRSDLLDAVNAIDLSKDVMRNIRENLFWAFFYNVIGIPIAAGVLYPSLGIRLSPMIGAAAMGFSSVFVVSNALRLRGFKPKAVAAAKDLQAAKAAGKEINMTEKTIAIEGMMCANCVKHVTKALQAIDGVTAAVSLEKANAVVTMTHPISDDQLTKAVVDAGYEVKDIH